MPVIPSSSNALGCVGTYKFDDVLTVAKELVHQIPTTIVQTYVCDFINSQIWLAYPWRWTRVQLTPFALVDGNQDYASVPPDFYRFTGARTVRTDVTPNQYQPLKISKHIENELQLKGSISTIQEISYEPEAQTFRLDRAASVSGTATYQIQAEYQKVAPKITATNVTMCQFDHYFNVMLEGVLWKFYALADDPRAGSVSINRTGDKQSAGQYGVFKDALEEMKRLEDNENDMQTTFPEDPLGWTRVGSPGLFGNM